MLKYILMKFWRCFVGESFYFFIKFIKGFEYWLIYAIFIAPNINIIDILFNIPLSPSIIADLVFSHETLLVSLYFGSLVNDFLNLLFPTIRKRPVTVCWWSLSIKPVPAKWHGKIILSWKKALTSRLEANLLKLNIWIW